MSALILTERHATAPSSVVLDPLVLVGLSLAAVIAWFQPFDLLFARATLGQPALRAGGIVALALAGGWIGRRVGLGVEAHGRRLGAVLFPALVAAVVGVACAVLDWAFSATLHPSYRAVIVGQPVALRMLGYMLRAFNENILYRLFLGSWLVWAFGRMWQDRNGGPAAGAVWAGFALSQAINVWVNVTSLAPLSTANLAHDALRYFAPGMVWSWLYWRRGFQANEIASTSVHLVFQPLVGLLLQG